MNRRLVIVAVLLVLFSSLGACTRPTSDGEQPVEVKTPDRVAVEIAARLEPPSRPKPVFFLFYTPPKLDIEAKIPPYELPLKPEVIANWAEASDHFRNQGTAELVLKNGFAVEEGWGEQLGLMDTAYDELPHGVPAFLTADTVLHFQHVLYDQLFREIEQAYLLADLQAITDTALDWFTQSYNAHQASAGVSPKQSVAARRDLAYFAVAARLLDPKAAIPKHVEKEVLAELRNIDAGTIAASPIFIYRIDYSQLKPRGHYTSTAALERYFRAMMWYAQCAFLFQPGIVDAGTADIQTIQAVQIGGFLMAKGNVLAKWKQIHAVVELFAGAMDDVSVADVIRIKQELDAALAAGAMAGASLGESAYLARLRERLNALPPPRIHNAAGLPVREGVVTPERRRQWLNEARGMRFFGQRFSLDGHAMSELIGLLYSGTGEPFTLTLGTGLPKRGYPSPLDVMTLLGSTRAEDLLRAAGDADYVHYNPALAGLKAEFAALTSADWHASLASARLDLLRTLLAPVPEGYPSAIRTPASHERSLRTALASWVQLKHDMVLAHKQPYLGTESLSGPSWDYAEPLPQLYAEVRAMNGAVLVGARVMCPDLIDWREVWTRLVNVFVRAAGFDAIRYQADMRERPPYLYQIIRFNRWLDRLIAISEKELRHEPLDEYDAWFFGKLDKDVAILLGAAREDAKGPVVVDVATEPNEGRVLEVATGRLDLLWIVIRMPDGQNVLCAGPVMSYYEFKQPLEARLTNQEWRIMLDTDAAPDPPIWTKSFLTRDSEGGR
ncbi:MAG: DUF3160 domain-containing protein [Verrucomicrobia bacterium]|nr:DUF3160 domain-containing protein [Verrucomicrobiota bacterium]